MEVSLIESNIDLVASVARKFKEDDDLFQIGMIALWEASEKWDHVHPFRPWARRVIRHRMIDHREPAQDFLSVCAHRLHCDHLDSPCCVVGVAIPLYPSPQPPPRFPLPPTGWGWW
ncbi:hypothetical protein B5F94_03625 [Flavonifractor sp. An4]|nr:hypothetical protein B5F94_03625 [Flavonifractor sp. An4]